MDFISCKRWRRIQELIEHFWLRWIGEWLPGLSKRHKWTKTRKDLKPGEVVLVINLNLPRGHWPLGRIIEGFPGKDGHVRVDLYKHLKGSTSFVHKGAQRTIRGILFSTKDLHIKFQVNK